MQSSNFQAVLSRVDQLSAKLGVAAGHIWGFYVRQAYVEATTDAIAAIVAAVLSYISLRLAISWGKKQEQSIRYSVGYGCAAATAGFVAIGFAITAFVNLYFGLQAIMNPQFWAFQQLISDLRGMF